MNQLCEDTAHFCVESCDRGRSAGSISQKSSIFQQRRIAREMESTVSAAMSVPSRAPSISWRNNQKRIQEVDTSDTSKQIRSGIIQYL